MPQISGVELSDTDARIIAGWIQIASIGKTDEEIRNMDASQIIKDGFFRFLETYEEKNKSLSPKI